MILIVLLILNAFSLVGIMLAVSGMENAEKFEIPHFDENLDNPAFEGK